MVASPLHYSSGATLLHEPKSEKTGGKLLPFPQNATVSVEIVPSNAPTFEPLPVMQSATPSSVSLGSLPHPELRLCQAIPLEIEREDDQVCAWSPDLGEYGYGSHLGEAIEDLQQTLIELYEALASDYGAGRLTSATAGTWEILRRFIAPHPTGTAR